MLRYRQTRLGREKWLSLINHSVLQQNCNKEGFNVLPGNDPSHSRARIGIIANQERDCSLCDSRVGFGTAGLHDDSNTCGNEATHLPRDDKGHIKTFGYVFVQ